MLRSEAVDIHAADQAIGGDGADNVLAREGSNPFFGGGGADIFGLGDGTQTAAEIGLNLVADFNVEEGDTIGLIGYGLDVDNFNLHIIRAFNGAFNAWT